jgi:hypothetical protein
MGRAVSATDTFPDVLKRIPAGELEEGGATIKSIASPEYMFRLETNPAPALIRMLFGANPLPMPGAALKYLREKLQPWLDAQGELMEPRPSANRYWRNMDLLAKMLAENIKGKKRED